MEAWLHTWLYADLVYMASWGADPRLILPMSFPSQLKFIKNLFFFHPSSNHAITTKFCTCHDSYAVIACAKFCSDVRARNRITKLDFPLNLHHDDKVFLSEVSPKEEHNLQVTIEAAVYWNTEKLSKTHLKLQITKYSILSIVVIFSKHFNTSQRVHGCWTNSQVDGDFKWNALKLM